MFKGVLDTNIITALFKGNAHCTRKFDQYLDTYGTVHLSVIVYYELYRGLLDLDNQRKLERFKEFVQNCTLLDVNQLIVNKASELYVDLKRKGELIQDADILIAATAIVHDMGVVTDNVAHFSRIEELKIDNWLK